MSMWCGGKGRAAEDRTWTTQGPGAQERARSQGQFLKHRREWGWAGW